MSLDIGGSLTKLVVRSPAGFGLQAAGERPDDDDFVARVLRRMPRHPGYRPELELSDGAGGSLSFLQFETRWMADFVNILEGLKPPAALAGSGPAVVPATGGGAFKYAPMFRERLGVELEPADEMHSLARGMRYFEAASDHRADEAEAGGVELSLTGAEMFTYDLRGDRVVPWRDPAPGADCLLVSIGSGVSVIRVGPLQESGDVAVERVNGCSVGGATFWGLCRLLTSYRTFDEAVQAAEAGDNGKLAMTVSDIYGGEYAKLGLPGDIVAADFGKIGTRRHPRAPAALQHAGGVVREPAVEEPDITRALLVMVLNNIAQVAHSSARQHGIDRIFFGGSFLRRGTMMRVLTSALKFWSANATRAGFMLHEGYFGAMGSMLIAADAEAARRGSASSLPVPGSSEWDG